MISVNQRSQHLIEDLIDKSDYYRVGIKKGYGRWIKSLDQILDGTKKYRMRAGYIKKRLLKEKWVEEECSSCGYNEIVIGKESVALRLDYIDGDVI